MGSHNQTQARRKGCRLQDLSIITDRTDGVDQVPRRELAKRQDPTIEITNGFGVLFYQKERWKPSSGTGLSEA
jgi:hypothetical protein